MGVKQLVVAAFILVLIQLWCCNGCLDDERVGLLQIQASFNMFWFPLVKTSNCCDWSGIECDAHTGRVIHLALSDKRDWDLGDWYLNASLFLPFKQLTSLDLSSSRITSCLQNEGFERWTELNKLKILDLSYNNFNNNILSSLSGLSFLKSLDLSYNNLKGSINLKELASLKNLEELNLSGNKNVSEFVASKDVRAPLNLKTIYLDHMTANGMPLLLKSLLPFTRLKTLSLQWNNLTELTFHYGHYELQSFKSLENLLLNFSVVDDNFFRSLDTLSSLKSLSFNHGYGLDNLQAICNLNLNYLQSLVLTYNNLSGGLPWCLSNLTSLQHLDLSFNSLVGNLSSSPLTLMNSIQYIDLRGNNFQIPISLVPLYNCSNLSYLDILGNDLYVETEWNNWIPKFQLEELHMSGDGCGGAFPKFLYGQHNLLYVDLSDNKMRGEFPHWLLENNTRLQHLILSNNSLTGTITLPTHSHVNMSALDISSNYFSGQIPTKFGSYFPNLYSLNMSHNELSGSFPPSIGNISSLHYLNMSHNELNGSFLLSIGNISSLHYLDMSHNHLFGELPKVLKFSSLRLFYISENNISGSLPIFSSSYLEEINLAKNILHGSLPEAFSNSSSRLRTLVLNHNLFTGTIPKWIENLSGLNYLQLAYNHLEGKIPTELCMLDNLCFVDLSNNNLSGHIPPCLKSSHTMSLHNHRNRESTKINPSRSIEFTTKNFSYLYVGITLALLSGIDLSCNKLTGKIPYEFGNLTKIKVLNLSHNSLRGLIPSTFSNLVEIETLDLSHNNLKGKIPSQLSKLTSISSFSVAYNNLSGRTPDFVNQFATFENTSYEGNPFLCGKPLSKSCEATVSPLLLPGPSTNSEDDDGFIDMEVFCVSFGVSYIIVLLGIVAVLYINSYWRRAWFYFIEKNMTDCYYFIVDLFNF